MARLLKHTLFGAIALGLGACGGDDNAGSTWNTGGFPSGGSTVSGGSTSGGTSGAGGSTAGAGGTVTPMCAAGTLLCNGVCVPIDVNNCGACGTVCTTGQACVNNVCTCQAPFVACSGMCVDTTSSPTNCGTCGTVCSAPTPFCSNGVCSAACAAGQTDCSGACVDVMTNPANCGSCGNACPVGQACVSGVCSCTAPQINCNGACVNPTLDPANCGTCGNVCASGQCAAGVCVVTGTGGSGGGTATGGSGGTVTGGSGGAVSGGSGGAVSGGSGGAVSGGSGGAATGGAATGGTGPDTTGAVTCTDTVYGSVTIPAGNMISDFANGTLYQIVQQGRGEGADPWHAYATDDVNDSFGEMATPSIYNPKHANNNFAVDTATTGPCNSGGSLHVSSPGRDQDTYVGFGIDFMARTAERKKQPYNASSYTGVGFWARCTADVQFAFLKTVDAGQDADIVSPQCSYSGTPRLCDQYGIKNAVMTNQWTYYKLYFDEMLQDEDSFDPSTTVPLDKSQLMAFQIQVNSRSDRSGNLLANPFECWIDDVHFMSDPAPQVPSQAVVFTTSGNTVSRNGSPHLIKGLSRASLEWDVSGFGITREDIQRMKAWGANTIRYSVAGGGASVGTWADWMNSTKSEIYHANVKRAIGWTLQEGMDVILDLHWVSGTPNSGADHTAFWSGVSSDPFYRDGRIIYELYNEPTTDIGTLRSWAQATVDMIRSNGANNLILVPGVDYSYDISGYDPNGTGTPITDSNNPNGAAIAYVTHPYDFKSSPGDEVAFISPSASIPVVATEFGSAYVQGVTEGLPYPCKPAVYEEDLTVFATHNIGFTGWAWIIDEWECGFAQLISDYSGTPNTIGEPVRAALLAD